MSVLTSIFAKSLMKQNGTLAKVGMTSERLKGMSEGFWFVTTLLLFLVMGPFSALAAVIGVFSVIPNAENAREPEAIG